MQLNRSQSAGSELNQVSLIELKNSLMMKDNEIRVKNEKIESMELDLQLYKTKNYHPSGFDKIQELQVIVEEKE